MVAESRLSHIYVVVHRVHDSKVHRGGLITHAPHRNMEKEMALHAMSGAPLDEFARTGKAPVGHNAPRAKKPAKKPKRKRPGSEKTSRAAKKQRRTRRNGKAPAKKKSGRAKRRRQA